MKKLNRNQWIAVAAGLGLISFLFYGGAFMNLFSQSTTNPTPTNSMTDNQTGVQKEDIVVGQGEVAAAGDLVTVNYIGTLTNGKVFDSSFDRHQPFAFQLGVGQVIRGWDEGVAGMRIGGKRRLVIAPDYGYGANAAGSIPPNSTLVFEVELLGVQHPKLQAQ